LVSANNHYRLSVKSVLLILGHMITKLSTSKFLFDLEMEQEVWGNEGGAESQAVTANTLRNAN
jgi:hypothetical protein